MAVEAALYPIDTIKTRLQLAASGGGIRSLLASGGGKALYAGVWGNLAGVAPASAIFMGVYEPTKRLVAARAREAAEKRAGADGEGGDPDRFEFLGPLVAGAAAGLASSAVRVPTEVVKQRLQAGQFGGRSAVAAVRGILAREGLRGMFAGYGSFLLRDLPFDAIEFVAYEQLKSAYERALRLRPGDQRRERANAAEVSAIGAAAGALTGVVTTPLDVLKTRLMTQGTVGGKYSGVVDCARQIARDEGVGALFRGWEPRVVWIGLGGCVFFSALEAAKRAYAPDEEAWAAHAKEKEAAAKAAARAKK